MGESKKSDHASFWLGCGPKTRTNCWWEWEFDKLLWKTLCHFLKRLIICLPYDSAIIFV